MSKPRVASRGIERRLPLGGFGVQGWIAVGLTGAILLPLLVLVATTSNLVGTGAATGIAVLLIGAISQGITRVGEAIVLLGAFLVPMNNLTASGAASFVTAADGAFLLGFLLLMPSLFGRPLHVPPIFLLGVVGVFSVALISSLLSEDAITSLSFMVRLLVGAFGLSVLFLWWRPEPVKLLFLAWGYVLGCVVSVAYGLVDGQTTGSGRYVGLTEHPNILGYTCMFGLALIPFIVAHTPPPSRWIPLLAGAGCAYGIWVSGSRAALATILVVAVVFPALKRSVLAGLALLASLATVLIFLDQLLSNTSKGNALGRLLGYGSSSQSDQVREQAAEKAINVFWSHPLVGQGFTSDPLQAHIIYLQILAALGIFGLAFHLLVLWTTVRPVLDVPTPSNLLALPALAYVVVGFISPVLWDRYVWVPLALALLAPTLVPPQDDDGPPTNDAKEAMTSGPR